MKTEKIFATFIAIGLFFKTLDWAGNSFILVIMLSALALLYMPFAFYFFSYKGLSNQKWGLSIVAGLAFFSAIQGILFKLLFWKGAGIMLNVGLMASLIALVFTFILSETSSEKTPKELLTGDSLVEDNPKNAISHTKMEGYFRNMKIRGIVITFFAFLLWVTPTSTIMSIQHHGDPEMARLRIRSMKNPGNEEFKREYKEYSQKNNIGGN